MTDRKLMQQALDALEEISGGYSQNLIAALRERLAQPEQKPVAWINWSALTGERRLGWGCESEIASEPLYTTPPRREWVGLTDEERNNLWREVVGWGDPSHDDEDLMKAIEAKLREKNA